MALVLVLTAVLAIYLIYKFQKRQKFLTKLKDIKGPEGWPLIGNALELHVHRRDVIKVLQNWMSEHGRCFRFFLAQQAYVLIANAEDMEKVLSSQVLTHKSDDYDRLNAWLGLGLLTGSGEKWFHRRKQLTPAFHFKILEDFLKVFNEQCETFSKVLEKQGTQAFDIFPIVTHCALDIICETAMGRPVYAQEQSDSDYVKAIYRMSELIQHRQLRPWFHSDFVWGLCAEGKEEKRCLEILHGFTNKVIRERKEERKLAKKEQTGLSDTSKADDDIYLGKKKKRLAFLDLLLDAQESDPLLKDENVREETDTFMFEGHDTTSAATSWTTFLIAGDPTVQKKVHEELDSIFGNDKDREVTMADLAEMKYLECCIKEGLRLYPSVPMIGRTITKELELSNGAVAPVSANFFIFFYGLHRDEKMFPNPEKFDPNRFLPENSNGRHPFAYVPFSAGPRNCIGQKFAMMEEKVMISTIFRKFTVKQMERREDVPVLCELITRPENGLKVALEKRK